MRATVSSVQNKIVEKCRLVQYNLYKSIFVGDIVRKTVLLFSAVFLVAFFCSCAKTEKEGFDGAIIAAELNSDGELAAQSYIAEGAVVETYNDVADCVLAVENGKVDYLVTDEFTASGFEFAGRRLVKYADCAYKTELCAVFADEDLRDEFNTVLDDFGNDGTYDAIKNSILNFEVYDVSGCTYEKGTLKILCDPSFATFMRVDDGGMLSGAEVGFARAIFAEMGYETEYVFCDFDELFTALENGEGDLIMSSVTYTAERAESYLFSSPYLTVNYVVLERGKQ